MVTRSTNSQTVAWQAERSRRHGYQVAQQKPGSVTMHVASEILAVLRRLTERNITRAIGSPPEEVP